MTCKIDPISRTNTPAQALSAALDDLGVTKRHAQALALGVNAGLWSRYVNGHVSPRWSKIERWLKTANENGHPMVLTWNLKDGCRAYSKGA
jgi:hypothetical protein